MQHAPDPGQGGAVGRARRGRQLERAKSPAARPPRAACPAPGSARPPALDRKAMAGSGTPQGAGKSAGCSAAVPLLPLQDTRLALQPD